MRFYLIIGLLIGYSLSFAQLKKANDYYERYDYGNAIPLYLKEIKKRNTPEAIEKLAHCYRITKNYRQAEVYYNLAVKQQTVTPINYFYYGQALKNNGKYEEAKVQFYLYSKQAPGDKLAAAAIKSCDNARQWIAQIPQYKISPVNGLNSPHSEFAPAVFTKTELAFTSSRRSEALDLDKYSLNNDYYLDVYSASYTFSNDTLDIKKIKKLSSAINSALHDGPLVFNAATNIACFTRVNQAPGGKTSRMKLYFSKYQHGKWEKAEAFPHNSDEYSVMHPAFSSDGTKLYFSSDMPGSIGGKDLYVSLKEGNSWSTPQNLGSNINTEGNELFPSISNDGILYFSSDGHPTLGGLDIFSSKNSNEKFETPVNAGYPLNTSTDDFGITFIDDYNGFFSSDREGGKGSDDIYFFTKTHSTKNLVGHVLLSRNVKDVAKNVDVLLLSDDGKILNVNTTDNNGVFKFEGLPENKKYSVKLDETDPKLPYRKKYFLTDEKDRIISQTEASEKGGKFLFTKLPADISTLPPLNDVEDPPVNIAGNLITGESPSKPISNVKVNLVTEKGALLQSSVTNAFGSFAFYNVVSDQNLFVKVDEKESLPPNTKILFTNKGGKEITAAITDKKGKFSFRILPQDNMGISLISMDDVPLRVSLKGKFLTPDGKPLTKASVVLQSQGKDVQTITTDATGKFAFTNLLPDGDYSVKLASNDPRAASLGTLIVADEKGNKINEISADNNRTFKFSFLPQDQQKLTSVYLEDSKLVMDLRGKLIGDNNKPIGVSTVNLINEKGTIIQTTTTDPEGMFVFSKVNSGKDYHIEIDEVDAQLNPNAKLLVTDAKGNALSRYRIDNTGKFKFKILPQEQIKLNTIYVEDTELKMDLKGKLLGADGTTPLANSTVLLLDQNGKVIDRTTTGASGAFAFANLPKNQNYSISLDENDSKTRQLSSVTLTDDKGATIGKINPKDKKFKFQLLAEDATKLKTVYVEDTWLQALDLKGKSSSSEGLTIIENAYYDFGDWHILPEARKTLDKAILVMKSQPDVMLELSAHTDSRADDEYNMQLSIKRAQAAVDYIISSGVSSKRLTYKGYGESKIINQCGNGAECTDEEHAKNRRTEFKIIRKK